VGDVADTVFENDFYVFDIGDLLRTVALGLEPNAQGKLLLEFVPVSDYATMTAIEAIPQ
jgi:hypothetical protein